MSRVLPVLMLAVIVWQYPCSDAFAHDLRPGAVAIEEVSHLQYAVRLTPPQDGSGQRIRFVPELPSDCRYERPGIVCDTPLRGPLSLPDLASLRVKVIVFLRHLNGQSDETVLLEGQTTADFREPEGNDVAEASSPQASTSMGVAPLYLRLGVEHILGGLDHLLFVLALALLARGRRRILLAVTGFTVAHSVTLAATALGFVVAPGSAVELVIAGSIVLLAVEIPGRRETLARRLPWLVASVFGLVHGFGFAGVLTEIGLPAESQVLALAMFNLGVEIGQIAVLAFAWFVAAILVKASQSVASRDRVLHWGTIGLAYGIGAVATVWTVDRLQSWITTLL